MAQKNILVVGGAGFIGSHVNKQLSQKGYASIVIDNLSQGNRASVTTGVFIEGDISDEALLEQVFTQYKIDAVMHFAAFTDIAESMTDPLKYFINNVSYTLNLLQMMRKHSVDKFIFSSSAAIYGIPNSSPISESHVCHPINPYGESKLMVETMLQHFERAYGIKFCSLRYFNAAGGDPDGQIKYYPRKASNLIPIILTNLLLGRPEAIIFGTDYPTFDGTCVRDYVHVEDLGNAHIAALEHLLAGGASGSYNLGNGRGFSVREVITAVEKVTGQKIIVIEKDRRPGDPAILIADFQKASRELHWQPYYSSLEIMIEHAWHAMQL